MSNPRHQRQTKGHRYALKRLSSYIDGQLSDQERARVQAHLKSCSDCREELRTLRWAQNLTQQMPVMPVPRSFIVREADLEARHIAQPRPLLIPTLARLQTAAAIVAVLLVMVVAGDVFVGRGLPGGQSARTFSMDAPGSGPATAPIAEAPKAMQVESTDEQTNPAPDAQIMSMAVPTETLTLTLVEIESAKVLGSPTADVIAEPSPTPPPRPTWTPAQAGHPAEETLTKSTPTSTATFTIEAPTATHTPTTEAPTATQTPIPTAADTATLVPTSPPAPAPTRARQEVAQVTEAATEVNVESETQGPVKEGADPPGRGEQWQGWRITQIGLGIVLAGLLIAILWLRRWGRLG